MQESGAEQKVVRRVGFLGGRIRFVEGGRGCFKRNRRDENYLRSKIENERDLGLDTHQQTRKSLQRRKVVGLTANWGSRW